MYAAGSMPEIPLEPKKPLAQGEAVRIVPGAEYSGPDTASREAVTIGCGLK